eukprot:871471_1
MSHATQTQTTNPNLDCSCPCPCAWPCSIGGLRGRSESLSFIILFMCYCRSLWWQLTLFLFKFVQCIPSLISVQCLVKMTNCCLWMHRIQSNDLYLSSSEQ